MTATNSRARKVRAVALTAVAIAALTLTACTASKPTSGSTTAAADRTLTIPLGSQPPSLDPGSLDQGQSAYIWSSVYDTLLYLDPQGTLKPNAAKSWAYTDDAKTLTLHLRDGMTFSDGGKVTAKDAAATLNYIKKTPGDSQGFLSNVSSIVASDPSTVVIKLSQPDSTLLSNLATSTGVIAETKDLGQKFMTLNPVGSGPYTLDKNTTVSGATYVLKKRKNYWNADAYPFGTFTLKVISSAQAGFNALQSGELDSGAISTQAQANQLKSADYDVKTLKGQAAGGLFILDRTGAVVPALAKLQVRQAINMAFDRQAYVDKLLGGNGSPTDSMFSPTGAAYDAKVNTMYKYDVAGAKKLLAEAGYPNGFSLSMPSTFLSTSFEPAVTQSLKAIGVTVNWVPTPPQDIASSVTSKQYGMVFYYRGFSVPAIDATAFAPGNFINPFNYTTPELDSLFKKAAEATTVAAQNAAFKAMNTYAIKQALDAPLFSTNALQATKKGIGYAPDGFIPILSVRDWTVTG